MLEIKTNFDIRSFNPALKPMRDIVTNSSKPTVNDGLPLVEYIMNCLFFKFIYFSANGCGYCDSRRDFPDFQLPSHICDNRPQLAIDLKNMHFHMKPTPLTPTSIEIVFEDDFTDGIEPPVVIIK